MFAPISELYVGDKTALLREKFSPSCMRSLSILLKSSENLKSRPLSASTESCSARAAFRILPSVIFDY